MDGLKLNQFIHKLTVFPGLFKLRAADYIPTDDIAAGADDVFKMISNVNLIDVIRFALIVGGVILVWKIASKLIKALVIVGIAVLIFSYFF